MKFWKRHTGEVEGDQELVERAAWKHDVAPEEVLRTVFNEPEVEQGHDFDPGSVGGEEEGSHDEQLYDGDNDVKGDPYLDDEDFDSEESDEFEGRRSRVGLFVTLILIGVVFGGVICGFMYLANSADKAGPTADSGLEALKQSIEPTPVVNPTLNGTHISFTYPSVFDVVTHPANWNNTTERYSLSSKSDYRKTIQVYVESVPSMQLDSGYLVRSQHTADYTPGSMVVMGEPAVEMVKNDQSERTLYWEHAGNLVIMSATGSGADMAGWINMISSSLRWLK